MSAGRGISLAQAREIDRMAQQKLGIAALVLMENAGRSVAEAAQEMLGTKNKVAVFCAGGNNGGDGFVCVRHLMIKKKDVDVYLVGKIDKLKQPARTNLNILINLGKKIYRIPNLEVWQKLKVRIKDYNLIIDGLLGIGISGRVREPFSSIIEDINNSQVPILSIDIPSGLDVDTGRPKGISIRARKTVTFVSTKKGFLNQSASAFTGQVIVRDIGWKNL